MELQVVKPVNKGDFLRAVEEMPELSYWASTLLALFLSTDALDSLVAKAKKADDLSCNRDLVQLLRKIVKALRDDKKVVKVDELADFRCRLEQIERITDAESLMLTLLRRGLGAPPFIQDAFGGKSYVQQLGLPKGKRDPLTLQELFNESVKRESDKFLLQPNPILILTLPPRMGNQRNTRILPTLELDLTRAMSGRPAPLLWSCGPEATVACTVCSPGGNGAKCEKCRLALEHRNLSAGHECSDRNVQSVKHSMSLVSVVFVENGLHKAFVKCKKNPAAWILFDPSLSEQVVRFETGSQMLENARRTDFPDPRLQWIFSQALFYIYEPSPTDSRGWMGISVFGISPKGVMLTGQRAGHFIQEKINEPKMTFVKTPNKADDKPKNERRPEGSSVLTLGFGHAPQENLSAHTRDTSRSRHVTVVEYDLPPRRQRRPSTEEQHCPKVRGIKKKPEVSSRPLKEVGTTSQSKTSTNRIVSGVVTSTSSAAYSYSSKIQQESLDLEQHPNTQLFPASLSPPLRPHWAFPQSLNSSNKGSLSFPSTFDISDEFFGSYTWVAAGRGAKAESCEQHRSSPADSDTKFEWIESAVDYHSLQPCVGPSSLHDVCGWKGIDLLRNSCYLDTALFAFFFCTDVLDSCCLRETEADNALSLEVKRWLCRIVNTLRKVKFVPGRFVMQFREMLVHEGNFTSKLLGSFMDAEEFLFILFRKSLALPPFLHFSNGQSDFLHQIFLPRTSQRTATVQGLLEESLRFNGNLRLRTLPAPALILLLPRSNGALVGFNFIVPSLQLDLLPVLADVRRCSCEGVASIACSLCPEDHVTFCEQCKRNSVLLHSQMDHSFTPRLLPTPTHTPRRMNLLAVVCVAKFHYTAFVRCGGQWLFYDSMLPKISKIRNGDEIIVEAERQHFAGHTRIDCPKEMRSMFTEGHYCVYVKDQ